MCFLKYIFYKDCQLFFVLFYSVIKKLLFFYKKLKKTCSKCINKKQKKVRSQFFSLKNQNHTIMLWSHFFAKIVTKLFSKKKNWTFWKCPKKKFWKYFCHNFLQNAQNTLLLLSNSLKCYIFFTRMSILRGSFFSRFRTKNWVCRYPIDSHQFPFLSYRNR